MSVQPQPGNSGNGTPGQYGQPAEYGQTGIPQGIPVRRNKPGSAVLVGGLSCCGLIVVIGIVIAVVAIQNIGNSDLIKSQSARPTVRQNLIEIRNGIDKYKESHGGKYPADLSEAVDPAYLSFQSPTTNQPVRVEYRVPTRDAPDTSVVASFFISQMNMSVANTSVDQKVYMRLLKNGTLVQDQITRSPLTTDD